MTKKPYLVSIHHFGGSMWEATGNHHVAELTDEEYEKLEKENGEFPHNSERGFWIQPITEIINYSKVLELMDEEGWSEGDEEED